MNIIPVTCRSCGGGENGEKASCIKDIARIVESRNIAYMLYSAHVEEKLQTLGYIIKYQYAAANDPTIPTGMWITKGEIKDGKIRWVSV